MLHIISRHKCTGRDWTIAWRRQRVRVSSWRRASSVDWRSCANRSPIATYNGSTPSATHHTGWCNRRVARSDIARASTLGPDCTLPTCVRGPRLEQYGWRGAERQGPATDSVAFWQDRAIDAIAATYQGGSAWTVQVPVIWSNEALEVNDKNYIIEALVNRAYESFVEMPEAIALRGSGAFRMGRAPRGPATKWCHQNSLSLECPPPWHADVAPPATVERRQQGTRHMFRHSLHAEQIMIGGVA